jgi:hypothetical protein
MSRAPVGVIRLIALLLLLRPNSNVLRHTTFWKKDCL